MYQEERMQVILNYLKEHKRINIEEICSLCDISRDTARRDLVKLENEGSILRTHGGALLPDLQKEIKNYKDRLSSCSLEKKAIGKLAASLIDDKDKIIMDTSTTVLACSEFLQEKNCTVITNSINQADILSNYPNIDIHLLGGKIHHEHKFLYGTATINMLSNYFVDKTLIGAGGITEDGLTLDDEEDGFVVKKMIEQASQVIVLADHSKFRKKYFFKVADLRKVNLIITDKMPDESFMKILNDNNIEIMIAQ